MPRRSCSVTVWRVKPGPQRDGSDWRVKSWRWDGEVAAGRGWALRCRGAGLRSRPEGGEQGAVRAREGGRRRGGRLEAQGRGDGERSWGRRPQGETLQHLSSEQHLVLARPFETFPQEQCLLGYSLPDGGEALIGSHKTRCADRMSLGYLSARWTGRRVKGRDRRGGGR